MSRIAVTYNRDWKSLGEQAEEAKGYSATAAFGLLWLPGWPANDNWLRAA